MKNHIITKFYGQHNQPGIQVDRIFSCTAPPSGLHASHFKARITKAMSSGKLFDPLRKKAFCLHRKYSPYRFFHSIFGPVKPERNLVFTYANSIAGTKNILQGTGFPRGSQAGKNPVAFQLHKLRRTPLAHSSGKRYPYPSLRINSDGKVSGPFIADKMYLTNIRVFNNIYDSNCSDLNAYTYL